MTKVSIELPATVTFSNKALGKLNKIDLAKLPAVTIARAAMFGLNTTCMNAYNSAAKDGHVAGMAAMDKRIGSLLRGDWEQAERGEGIMTTYKDEVFIPLCLESGLTLKEAEALIKAKVKEAFPPETKATFANFFEATAAEQAADFDGDVNAAREALEAYYDDQLATRRAAREKAAEKVKTPKIDLAAFRKPAK